MVQSVFYMDSDTHHSRIEFEIMTPAEPSESESELREAAEQLLGDIGAMRSGAFFGDFPEWRGGADGDGVRIEWPNLSISAERLRRALSARPA
jgi:hypothetical protein